MKKIYLLIIGFILSLTGNSKSFQVGGFEYEVIKKSLYHNGVVLTKDLSKKSNVIIPDIIHYEGTKYIVEEIGTNAFRDNEEVLSITVPGSVYVIDNLAFQNLRKLKSIIFLPTKMEQEIILKKHQPKDQIFSSYSPNLIIKPAAFSNCESLVSVDFSQRRPFIYIFRNGAAFGNCKSLKSIKFNEVRFSREDQKLFKGCHSLTEFIISDRNPSKYKHFFEDDSPFMTQVYPIISSLSDEEYTKYLIRNGHISNDNEIETVSDIRNEGYIIQSKNIDSIQALVLSPDIMTVPIQRKDLNGKICALLKVMVSKKGLTFEGNVIGTVDHKNGNEYWVYVSPGTKKVKIKVPGEKSNVLDLDHYKDLPAFESKRIYEYSFETTPIQRLNLTYTPIEATILIDGNLQDGQNGEVHAYLPLGEHSYMVVAKGYVTSEGLIKLTSKGETSIIVNLTPFSE